VIIIFFYKFLKLKKVKFSIYFFVHFLLA